MIETTAWDGIRPLFHQLGLDPVRVENVLRPGHPDVDYTHGNIELKYMERFPVGAATRVRVPKLTGEQVGWLTRRSLKGGLCWLLVRVGKEWYLFPGADVYDVWKGLTQAEWRSRAALVFGTQVKLEVSRRLRALLTGAEVL